MSDVCLETVPAQKASQPAAIHDDGDLGDTIGMDVACWTNREGKTSMFTHIVDESTLSSNLLVRGEPWKSSFQH